MAVACQVRQLRQLWFLSGIGWLHLFMLASVSPKLPMLRLDEHLNFYVDLLQFSVIGDYGDYLLVKRDDVELHFFAFAELDPKENYGQAYIRVETGIELLFEECQTRGVPFTGGGKLERKPWGLTEFSILDPANNCLTFGCMCGS